MKYYFIAKLKTIKPCFIITSVQQRHLVNEQLYFDVEVLILSAWRRHWLLYLVKIDGQARVGQPLSWTEICATDIYIIYLTRHYTLWFSAGNCKRLLQLVHYTSYIKHPVLLISMKLQTTVEQQMKLYKISIVWDTLLLQYRVRNHEMAFIYILYLYTSQ